MMNSMDQKRLDRLYKLLEREKNPDNAAALRWAVFMLEQFLKRKACHRRVTGKKTSRL